MPVALQSPTASLENMDLPDLVKATSSGRLPLTMPSARSCAAWRAQMTHWPFRGSQPCMA
eukprot:1800763-Pleurochrysis_carterae.AAC.1